MRLLERQTIVFNCQVWHKRQTGQMTTARGATKRKSRHDAPSDSRRQVAPQSVEEVQAIQDAYALVVFTQGAQMGVIRHQVSRFPYDSAGDHDVVIGISGNARKDVSRRQANSYAESR